MVEIIIQIILVIAGAIGGFGFGRAIHTKPDAKINVFNIVMVSRLQLLHISTAMWFISGVLFMMI